MGIVLISHYPPGGLQNIYQPQGLCDPCYYEPCGFGIGSFSGYLPSCYEPRGYRYIYGSNTGCFVPRHYGSFSGSGCSGGSRYYSYGRSCYDPCDYGPIPVCRKPCYAYRCRYSCKPISCDPCYYSGRALGFSAYRGYSSRGYSSCGSC